jgi:hypothetical protein
MQSNGVAIGAKMKDAAGHSADEKTALFSGAAKTAYRLDV